MDLSLMFRKFFLVAAMLGIEGCVAFEMILLIANVQTLGVPVSYSSLPATVGASCGFLLTPVLGVLTDKLATSKLSKAKILIVSISLQMSGTVLVFTANCLKIFVYGASAMRNESSIHQLVNTTSHVSERTLAVSYTPQVSDVPDLVDQRNVSFYGSLGYDTSTVELFSYTPLVLVGFGLMDFGNSISFCFFKTFSLACVCPEEHSSILVKSSFAASLGGCLVAVLGSVGLGSTLTAGTTYDIIAAKGAFLSAFCCVLLAVGLSVSLTTAFTSSSYMGFSYEELVEQSVGIESGPDKVQIRSSVLRRIYRQRKQIVINVSTFFLMASLCSFETYMANFVGQGILGGDSQADRSSQPYKNYVRGIEIGSSGTLIYYISFTLFNSCQEIMLARIGWKTELSVACAAYILCNLLCVLTSSLWSFYLTAVWDGIFRTVVLTVPFILANQTAMTKSGDQSTGRVMSAVASMLPAAFIVTTAVMGPLSDVTGSPATPVYYTVVTCLLGLAVMMLNDIVD